MCRIGLSVGLQLPKLAGRVRLPYPAFFRGEKVNLSKKRIIYNIFILSLCLVICGCSGKKSHSDITSSEISAGQYGSSPYVEVNGNVPMFSEEDKVTTPFEIYSELDSLGRCGVAYANICKEIMPTQERGTIGNVKPSGWHTVNYHELIDGNYLYNRCHLIAFELAGENDNEKNLITGTRYFNVNGMLPFENKVAAFVKSTGYHVLYRVTPVFEGDNLVASGVYMEAFSVEDNGSGICFNVFVYNVQPGIDINYANGESCISKNQDGGKESLSDDSVVTEQNNGKKGNYVLNINTKKFHYDSCSAVESMAQNNKKYVNDSRESIINQGYSPCKICNP